MKTQTLISQPSPQSMGSEPSEHLSRNCSEPLGPELRSVLARNHNRFLRYLECQLGDHDEAEDVLQDFYVRVLIKSRQIRNSQAIVSWLRQVLRSVLIDYFRRQSVARRVQREFAEDPLAITVTERQEFVRSNCACFYKFIPALKAEYAEVLRRVDLAGESRDEAAVAVGVTTGNIRVRLHRGRQALRRHLQHSCSECRSHGCFHSSESNGLSSEAMDEQDPSNCNASVGRPS